MIFVSYFIQKIISIILDDNKAELSKIHCIQENFGFKEVEKEHPNNDIYLENGKEMIDSNKKIR